MGLLQMPNEILDQIILETLPEDFESLSLGCKRLFALGAPFVERHNALRKEFSTFVYRQRQQPPHQWIRTAYDMIVRIAVEPIVARYIHNADFTFDSSLSSRQEGWHPLTNHREDVERLFSQSLYLKHAGLDWKEYYSSMAQDVQRRRYSHHAAAFLLTLLPNVKRLKLPTRWELNSATDKLVDTICLAARQSHLTVNSPSLAKVTWLGPNFARNAGERFPLYGMYALCTLPEIRYFEGPSCVSGIQGQEDQGAEYAQHDFAPGLNTVRFTSCDIDHVGILSFLHRVPGLKTLAYSHKTKRRSQLWDICQFVRAIEKEVGNSLENLSISFDLLGYKRDRQEPIDPTAPGRVSMRGFTNLRQLEFPLEIVKRTIYTALADLLPSYDGARDLQLPDQIVEDYKLSLSYLIPPAVAVLSLVSRGKDRHNQVLDILFRNFAEKKDLPALQKVHISYPRDADPGYKTQCTSLIPEVEKTGVTLSLHEESGFHISTAWAERFRVTVEKGVEHSASN